MAISTAAARLRRTFHYPDDEGDSSNQEVLDEQEQEAVITQLVTERNTHNASLLRLLFLLPALSCLPFLLRVLSLLLSPFSTSSSSQHGTTNSPSLLLSLLGLTSLAATAWLLYRLDTTQTGFAFLDGSAYSSPSPGIGLGSASRGSDIMGGRRRRGRGRGVVDLRGLLGGSYSADGSPLERYLPYLNLGLAGLALVTGLLHTAKSSGLETAGVSPILLGALPGVVYAAVVGFKVAMKTGADPEKELGRLRYGYKGA